MAPSALLIVNLGAASRIRAGVDVEEAEYADGVVVTTPSRALEFGYPPATRSVGVHLKPWGLAPFVPMPAAELCDRPVSVEDVWGRPTVVELRDRLATAAGAARDAARLEDELMRRLCKTAGLGLVRHASRVIAAAGGAVTIGDLTVAAGVSSTHLAQRFKQVIGFTPKRLDRTDRFAAAVRAIDPSSGRHRERRRGSASDARRRRRGSSSCASWPFLPLARRAGNSPPGDCSGDCFVSS